MPAVTSKSSPLNILQIASGDLWAGAEVQMFTLSLELHRAPETNLCVVLLNHGTLENKLLGEDIPVFVIDENEISALETIGRLKRIIRKQDIHIIHTHRAKENILGSIAGLLAGRAPSIRTVHGSPEHGASWKKPLKLIINLMDRICGRYLQDAVVSVSQDLAIRLQDKFPPRMISVIENGIVPAETYTPKAISAGETTRIGIAGRLMPVKRVDIFIKAAEQVRSQFPEWPVSFHIYGDGPLRRDLENLASNLGVTDIVHFEGHCDDMHDRLRTMGLLMMTSDHEGTPMVLLEAMSLGVPIVAHAIGGISEVLDQGNCGLLVSDHSPEGYVRALAEYMADRNTVHNQLARAAHTHLSMRFSAHHNTDQYKQLYTRLAGL